MKKTVACCVSFLAVCVMAATASGAVRYSRIVIGVDPNGELHRTYYPPEPGDPSNPYNDPLYDSGIPDFKSPTGLRDSDIWVVDVDYHVSPTAPGPGWGWAGSRIKVHNLDPFEVDILGVGPGQANPSQSGGSLGIRALHDPLIDGILPQYSGSVGPGPLLHPFGPPSNNLGSVPRWFTVVHPFGQQSGIDPSAIVPLLRLTLHAKNTFYTPGNSDIDVTFMLSDIWHQRGGPGSQITTNLGSNLLWAYSTPVWDNLHIPPGQPGSSMYQLPEGPPLEYPSGHWVHIPGITFHSQPGPGSAFVAVSVLGRVGLGIDHIPEPASALLLGLAAACTVMGVRSRRKRLQQ